MGRKTNHAACTQKVTVFTFPREEKPELKKKWETFVSREEVGEKHVIYIEYLQGVAVFTALLAIFMRIKVWWSRREK